MLEDYMDTITIYNRERETRDGVVPIEVVKLFVHGIWCKMKMLNNKGNLISKFYLIIRNVPSIK